MTEAKEHKGLTSGQNQSDINDGESLSLRKLASLVKRCNDGTASADDSGLFAFLRDELIEQSLMAAGVNPVQFERVIRAFFQTGNASESAATVGIHATTAQRWVTRFADLASRVQERRKVEDAADAACELICDRKRQHKPSFGSGKWSDRKIRNRPLNFDSELEPADGGLCSGCPRRQI